MTKTEYAQRAMLSWYAYPSREEDGFDDALEQLRDDIEALEKAGYPFDEANPCEDRLGELREPIDDIKEHLDQIRECIWDLAACVKAIIR